MNLDHYDTSNRIQCRIMESVRITPDESPEEVREIVLNYGDEKFSGKEGQTIGVLIPGPHPSGNKLHFRLYTIADIADQDAQNKSTICIVVKRCNYIDEYSGEEYQGIASNYLCNLRQDDQLIITGPFGYPFEQPDELDANIIMIGLGTGIAPFRAFVKKLHREKNKNNFTLRLFYGARTGMEMLYMNDRNNDLANYFDDKTFKAIQALSPRPDWQQAAAIDQALQEHSQEIWKMICGHNTYVYVAGIAEISNMLDKAFGAMAGSNEKWQRRKSELIAGRRWVELIY